MLGLSMWAARRLEAFLAQFPHILPTVASFARDISGTIINEDEVLAKFDEGLPHERHS